MEKEEAFVQFFWIDHHVVTNHDLLEANLLNKLEAEQAY